MIYFVYGTGECETLHSNFDIKDFSQGCFPIVYRREPGYKIKGEAYKLKGDVERSVHLLEIGAGYKPAEIKIDKEVTEKCIMFVYPKEPTMAISDSFISTRDNTKEWLNP
jgi:gamma-glutamylcyclotransferase (GGCT)/AIG2-like uncharacterized protein YtfP